MKSSHPASPQPDDCAAPECVTLVATATL
ncbi:GTP cyclohydrolase II, partial [Burkholderia pseudomallei]